MFFETAAMLWKEINREDTHSSDDDDCQVNMHI